MNTVLLSLKKVETANTNLDGTGDSVFLGEIQEDAYVHEIQWNSLGTNAACVGRLFADMPSTTGSALEKVLVCESTLASTTASNTASLAAVTTSVGAYYPKGTTFHASVSVDLTASAGYACKVHVGGHSLDF